MMGQHDRVHGMVGRDVDRDCLRERLCSYRQPDTGNNPQQRIYPAPGFPLLCEHRGLANQYSGLLGEDYLKNPRQATSLS